MKVVPHRKQNPNPNTMKQRPGMSQSQINLWQPEEGVDTKTQTNRGACIKARLQPAKFKQHTYKDFLKRTKSQNHVTSTTAIYKSRHVFFSINRGSYMSAHVLLNLLKELGKIDKMRGLPSILSLFRNDFNKFNYTGARMLDSIYHYDILITSKSHFCRKSLVILSLYTQSSTCFGRHNVFRKTCKPPHIHI